MAALTPYPESLERVRSVLVFFAATGPANVAVLAELEAEVRSATLAGRMARLSLHDIQTDLELLAAVTLVESAAVSASAMMDRWAAGAFERAPAARAPNQDTAHP